MHKNYEGHETKNDDKPRKQEIDKGSTRRLIKKSISYHNFKRCPKYYGRESKDDDDKPRKQEIHERNNKRRK